LIEQFIEQRRRSTTRVQINLKSYSYQPISSESTTSTTYNVRPTYVADDVF